MNDLNPEDLNREIESLTLTKIGEPYLRLQLDKQTPIFMAMKYTQSVVIVPANRVTPIPNLSDCILGLLYQRSRVFWVVDLPQIVGLSSVDRNLREYHIAIVKINNVPLGLAVPEIKGISRIIEENIKTITSTEEGRIASKLIPYLKGCFVQEKEVLPVIDVEVIVKSPLLH
jgi:twitching motility protein PilI